MSKQETRTAEEILANRLVKVSPFGTATISNPVVNKAIIHAMEEYASQFSQPKEQEAEVRNECCEVLIDNQCQVCGKRYSFPPKPEVKDEFEILLKTAIEKGKKDLASANNFSQKAIEGALIATETILSEYLKLKPVSKEQGKTGEEATPSLSTQESKERGEKANLGLAKTSDLIYELSARCDTGSIDKGGNYRTIDS